MDLSGEPFILRTTIVVLRADGSSYHDGDGSHSRHSAVGVNSADGHCRGLARLRLACFGELFGELDAKAHCDKEGD